MSALLNRCVTCNDASGLLIPVLSRRITLQLPTPFMFRLIVIGDVIAITLLVMIGISVPSWLHPCIFYLQVSLKLASLPDNYFHWPKCLKYRHIHHSLFS